MLAMLSANRSLTGVLAGGFTFFPEKLDFLAGLAGELDMVLPSSPSSESPLWMTTLKNETEKLADDSTDEIEFISLLNQR